MHPLTLGLVIAGDDLRNNVRGVLRNAGVRIVLDQEFPVETLQLKRLSLDVVLTDVNPEGETLDEAIRRIKMVSPQTIVAVVHDSPDPEVILSAMRSGAEEFILPPFEEKLTAALQRISGQIAKREAASRPAGRIAGFVSAKGGCGASTVACHVASEFQRATQHDVLLTDLDLESGLVGFMMKTGTQYSILDALKNVHRLDYSFWKGLISNTRPRLDVMPGPGAVTVSDPWDPANFREVFRLVRSMYGWVIADMGRSLNQVLLSVLDELDEIFLVTTPSVTALYQSKLFIARITDMGFPRNQLRLVVNRVPKRHEFTSEDMQRSLGIPVFAELPDRPELDDAYAAGKLLGGNSDLGRALSGLTLKMAGMQEERPKSWSSFFTTKKEPSYLGA